MFWLIVCAFWGGCSSKNIVTMSVTEPAVIHVPPTIKKVGIINRSVATGGSEDMDKIDKVLSMEGKDFDRDGSNEVVNGLFDELIRSGAFEEIKIIENTGVSSPGLGVFPATLAWSDIERLCDEQGVDAIFSLCSYDTDTKIDYQTAPVEVSAPLGIKVPAIEHRAQVTTLMKTGWRIYDPTSKFVLDEFMVKESVVSRGRGINPVKAAEAVVGRKEAVLRASNSIGQRYATRLFPYRVRVSRQYYVKGTDNFKVAKRRAQTGNWDGAAALWEQEISNRKSKVAGRACYNMAIINEINGNLLAAINWATMSYTDYENKLALDYLKILKYRMEQSSRLAQQ